MMGYTVVDAPSIIATHMTEIIRRNIHELLSRQDVQTLIDNAKESYPAVVEELIPKLMSLGEIQKCCQSFKKVYLSGYGNNP